MIDKEASVENNVASVARKNSTSNNWLHFLKSKGDQGSKSSTSSSKNPRKKPYFPPRLKVSPIVDEVEAFPRLVQKDFPRYKTKPEPEPEEPKPEPESIESDTPADESELVENDTVPFDFPIKPFRNSYVALDCEMVGIDRDKKGNMLGRVSIVNWAGDCIYDKYVKPMEKVTDYRTKVSGLKPSDLTNGENFATVQKEVANILKGKILVGHALHNDFKVLFLNHPRRKVRDTSTFYKFRQACGKRPSLKKLVTKFLNKTIQEGEHCSIEDARATMQLFQLVCDEWESSSNLKKMRLKKV